MRETTRLDSPRALLHDAPMASTQDFHEEMLSLYDRTGRATGGSYWPSFFLRAVRQDGGLAVAKKLLAPNTKSTGFGRLVEVSRADLSVEAIALDGRFRHLFSGRELDVARKRLVELPQSIPRRCR